MKSLSATVERVSDEKLNDVENQLRDKVEHLILEFKQ